MKKIFHNASTSGGVYKILNIVNGRQYFGSTNLFYKRAQAHINDLETNRHSNLFLQNDFNKCGKDSFLFEVIEIVQGTKLERLVREQFFLDKFYDNQKNCYNIVKEAQDNRGGTRSKKTPDPLTDKRFKTPSKETLEKRGKAIKEAKDNPESKERARENCKNGLWKDHSANITLFNKTTGEKFLIETSLRQFALDRGLSYKSLHLMVRGKTKSSGGWVKEA